MFLMPIIPDEIIMPERIKRFINDLYRHSLINKEQAMVIKNHVIRDLNSLGYYDTDLYNWMTDIRISKPTLYERYLAMMRRIQLNACYGMSTKIICGRGGMAKIVAVQKPDMEYIIPFKQYHDPLSTKCTFNHVISSFILKGYIDGGPFTDTFPSADIPPSPFVVLLAKKYKTIRLFYPDIDLMSIKVDRVNMLYPYRMNGYFDEFDTNLTVPIDYTNLKTNQDMFGKKKDDKFVKKYINKRRRSK